MTRRSGGYAAAIADVESISLTATSPSKNYTRARLWSDR